MPSTLVANSSRHRLNSASMLTRHSATSCAKFASTMRFVFDLCLMLYPGLIVSTGTKDRPSCGPGLCRRSHRQLRGEKPTRRCTRLLWRMCRALNWLLSVRLLYFHFPLASLGSLNHSFTFSLPSHDLATNMYMYPHIDLPTSCIMLPIEVLIWHSQSDN